MSGQENSLLIQSMADLTKAMSQHTQVVKDLVESNTQILAYLMSQEGEGDQDTPPERYLDGSPCR
ncbi:hypothetical protein IFR09_11240 [Pseudomonas syringae]|nr:hypothetical protein [Pseudomonas syringae]MBD8790952.1 hypothetical protein [Pseudomonas syringae]MBD8801911.1 hypothetical protein [Pseudomonas syringae]MBD8811739.1 hypothetical protein [Pseudomonas syringae]